MKSVITVNVLTENENGEILFLQEKDEPVYGMYNLPGGHLEANESFIECAVREIKEEIGLSIQPDSLIGIYQHNKNANGVNVVFFVKVSQLEPIINEDEILSYRWFKPEEFLKLDREEILNPNKHVRILNDYLSGRRIELGILSPIIYEDVYETK